MPVNARFPIEWALGIACLYWGIAVYRNQHHLHVLIPQLYGFLLVYGAGMLVVSVTGMLLYTRNTKTKE